MKTKLETLESIHDSLQEEAVRLEIAVRNLADRDDDDVVVPRLSPFSTDGQKTKKELVAEYQDRIEKLPHVALECVARPRIIPALPPDHTLGGQHTFVRSLIDPARKRIGDKGLLKNRIESSEDRMVQNPIAHRGLVNVAHFRIADIETLIRPVGVAFG